MAARAFGLASPQRSLFGNQTGPDGCKPRRVASRAALKRRPIVHCARRLNPLHSREEFRFMRAEIEHLVEEIKQSASLLRRHL
jgi:hypothetical protein